MPLISTLYVLNTEYTELQNIKYVINTMRI